MVLQTANDDADDRELRIAPVMTGGSSLAVWMGGVTAELYRMLMARRHPDGESACSIYRGLLELTATTPRVDVITGTSAGGLNGVLLAAAWRHDLRVDEFLRVRDLWLELGDLGALLRSPNEPDPPSLLRGDDYFMARLREILEGWRQATAGRAPGDERPVDLLVTVTTLTGEPSVTVDDFDQSIGEPRFAHHLMFEGGDLDGADWPARLALAARTSASLPGVFEPSFLPVGDPPRPFGADTHPDLAGNATISASRWAVDGGVIVNLPLGEALDRIYRQPADREVRRVVLYVKPTPTIPDKREPDDAATVPSVATALMSVIDGPRAEGVIGDLDQLRRHNLEADRQRVARNAGVELNGGDLMTTARGLWPVFARLRVLSSVASMMERLRRDLPPAVVAAQPRIEADLRDARAGSLPDAVDDPASRGAEWAWGISSIERGIDALLDVYRDLLATRYRPAPGEAGTRAGADDAAIDDAVEALEQRRADVLGLRSEAFVLLRRVRQFRRLDGAYWARAVEGIAAGVPPGWAVRSYAEWPFGPADRAATFAEPRAVARLLAEEAAGDDGTVHFATHDQAAALAYLHHVAQQLAGLWVRSAGVVEGFAAAAAALLAPDPADDPIAALTRLVSGGRGGVTARQADRILAATTIMASVVAAPGADHDTRVDATLANLLALHVVDTTLEGGDTRSRTVAEFMQVSWDAPNELDPIRRPAEKLAGTEIGRLGAFLTPTWRANDWFWGRMDGAQRLARLLLDPRRLHQRGCSRDDVVAALDRVLGDAEPVRVRWRADLDALRSELAFLDTDREVPAQLPVATGLVALALQLQIAAEELPRVRQAITVGQQQGAAASALGFAALYDRTVRDGHPAPDDVPGLVRDMRIGQESARSELGGDLLVGTASRGANIAVRGISGSRGVPFLGSILTPLRLPAGIADAFVRATMVSSRVGALAVAIAMTVAAAVVAAWWSGVEVATLPRLAAAVVLVTGTGLAALRARSITGAVVVAALAVVGFTVVGEGWDELLTDDARPEVRTPVDFPIELTDATVRIDDPSVSPFDAPAETVFESARLTVVGGEAAIVEPGRDGGLPGWKRTWLVPGSDDEGTPVLFLLPFGLAAGVVAWAAFGLRRRGLAWLDDRRLAGLTIAVAGALIWWFEGREILRAAFTGDPTGWKDDVIRWGDDLASARFGVLLVVLVVAATIVSVVLTRALWAPIARAGARLGWSTRHRLNRERPVG